jgi:hypothetical protein
MASLVIIKGPNPGRRFPLAGDCTLIGRQPDAAVYLESLAVSRHHARIVHDQGGYVIEDLRSSNRTWVNGGRINGRAPLTERDRLQIGPYVLSLLLDWPSETEDEETWLTCADPERMLSILRRRGNRVSFRKLRLRVCADCRLVWPLVPGEESRRAVETIERAADENVADDDAWDKVFRDFGSLASGAWRLCRDLAVARCAVLRCLFGNPFRPVSVNPAWQTPDVRSLAEGIYEERAFDRLPILADALEEAGCTDPAILGHCRAILGHCRDRGEHARGCWVIDLLTGRE